MKTKPQILIVGIVLSIIGTALGQPIITQQPQSCTNNPGTTATFTVVATGLGTLTYQWQDYYFGAWQDLAEGTNRDLYLTNVQGAQDLDYRVVVSDSTGTTNSDVVHLTVNILPKILTQPTNWPIVSLGVMLNNRVVAVGRPAPGYQWRLNGSPIPDQTASLMVLTNVQTADQGSYDVLVTNNAGAVTSRVATLIVDSTFTKVTTGALVTDAEGSVSGSWADFDNDGYVDLFVANYGSASPRSTLYHNNGGTNFTRVTASPIGTDLMQAWFSAWADYDNDGNVDLVAASFNGGALAQRLYRNNGGGSFTAVVDTALRSDTAPSTSPWWLDYDNDGFLDLFVTKGFLSAPANDCLFRNNGDGTFKKMTTAEVGPIVDDRLGSEFCSSINYDNDGRQELEVYYNLATGYSTPTWQPQSDGTFLRLTNGMPLGALAWGDYDNDGWLDGFGFSSNGEPLLFRNLTGGSFTNGGLKVTLPFSLASPAWGDYDNDGWLDVFCTSVYGYATNTLNGLFHNNGDGTFTQILTGSPVYDLGRRWAPSWADYNNDGFLDLFVAVGDGQPERNLLYRNNGNANRWLKVRLDGRASNRSGVGANVLVQATIKGRTFLQVREINCGVGQGGQSGLLAHFGLGDATNVTTLEIKWPSGIVQTLTNVAVGQMLTVEEHQAYIGPTPALAGVTTVTNGLQLSITEPAAGAIYTLEASTNLVTWTKLMARTSAGATFAYTDTRTASYPRRFYRVVVP